MTIILLLILLLPSLASAQIPAALGWYSIPNTTIRSVGAVEAGLFTGYFYGVSGTEDITAAWNGGIFDTTRNRLILWGGGHNGYYGNELYALNLDTLTIQRINNPTIPPTTTSVCAETLSDGKPNSRHTYSGLEYLPLTDELISNGGSVSCLNSAKSTATWTNALSSLAWTNRGPTCSPACPNNQEGRMSVYDRNSGTFMIHDDFYWYRYNRTTNTWTRGITDAGVNLHQSAVFDPVRNTIWAVGQGAQYKWPLVNAVVGARSNAGLGAACNALVTAVWPGLAYDPVQDRIIGWVDGNTVYVIDPDNPANCSTLSFSGGPSATASGTQNGIHGRFRYSPKSNVFVVCNDVDANCYSLRLTVSGTAKHDFVNRAYNPNVVRSNSFDATADFPTCSGGSNGCYTFNYGIIPPSGTTDYTRATRDTTQTASGASSLRFRIPTNSPSDTSGEWFTNFSTDLATQFKEGQEFFIQWRNRFDSSLLTTFYTSSDGFKQMITGVGDMSPVLAGTASSCTTIDMVIQNIAQRGFLQTEHGCGHYIGTEPRFSNPNLGGATDIYLAQNSRASPYCSYAHGPSGSLNDGFFPPGKGTCFPYFANEWMTFQVGITLGAFTSAAGCVEPPWIGGGLGTSCYKNSRMRIWIARAGLPDELVTDFTRDMYANTDANGNNDFGKVHLLPYQTNKSSSQTHPETYMWVDELIISRTKITAPLQSTETTPPSAPTNLTVTAISSTQIDLSWTASTDNVAVQNYEVERCPGGGCSSFAAVSAPLGITFSDTGLTPGTYGYRVRAVDTSLNVSTYSSVGYATTLTGGGGSVFGGSNVIGGYSLSQ